MKRFVLISMMLMLMLMFSLAACGGGSDRATPAAATARAEPTATAPTGPQPALSPTAAPSPQPKPNAAAGQPSDARAIIGAAANKWNTNGPYKMHITSNLAGTHPADMLMVPPDSSRFTQTLEDGSLFESIKIGPANYSFVNGAWTATTSEAIKFDDPTWTDPAALNDILDIKSLGSQTVNGFSAVGYTFADKSAPGETNTMWIGPNGAPVQVISSKPEETVTMDIVYDASIKVEAPVK